MPQEIRVLQCFHCYLYQADIAKKSMKWQCRMCNIKQTVRKEYFQGTGAECRAKVQELNMSKGKQDNEITHSFFRTSDQLNASSSLNISLDEDRKRNLSIEKETSSSSTKNCSSSLKTDNESIRKVSTAIHITTPRKKSKWDDYA